MEIAVSCRERCPHFRGKVFGTQQSVLNTEVSFFKRNSTVVDSFKKGFYCSCVGTVSSRVANLDINIYSGRFPLSSPWLVV